LTKKFTKQQINQILNIQGYYALDQTTGVFKRQLVDIFKLTAALFIGNDKTKGEWGESNILLSDRRVHIALTDFKDCQTKEDVKKTFKTALRRVVTSELFKRVEL
jgi:hypothetical protein